MPRVRFTLPQVKTFPDTRPSACPYCDSTYLNRHGPVTKPIRDLYLSEVTAHRYRCCDCGRTFRTILRELTVMTRVTDSGGWQRLVGLWVCHFVQ